MKRAQRVSIKRLTATIVLASLLLGLIFAPALRAKIMSAREGNISNSNAQSSAVGNVSAGRLAFASERDDNYEIYIMDADGSGQLRLTSNQAADREPSITRDGARIAFVSNRDNNTEIYSMQADGGAQTRLTNNAADDLSPVWSPDGTRIAFVSNRNGNDEVYLMNADGSGVVNLTNNAADDNDPAWSPDGLQIAFTTDRDGNEEVYVMSATGIGQSNLTNNAADDAHPSWSPGKIFFQSDRDENFDIYSMNTDGSVQTRLTNNAEFDIEPSATSDGARLTFTSSRDGSFEIYLMNADGSGAKPLTVGDGSNDLESSVQTILAPGAGSTSTVQFSAAVFSVSEGANIATITVTRTGDTSAPATVDFSATGGTASELSDFTPAFGTLRFAPGESTKTFTVLITDNAIAEEDETVNLALSNANGTGFGARTIATLVINDNESFSAQTNPIDDAQFFVRQHYADFLNRAPDAAGLAFWTNQITECEQRPIPERQGCREVRRINVSAAFFLSIEFQETGGFVIRLQRAAFGRKSDNASTRVTYRQFVKDAQQVGQGVVVGQTGYEQLLAQNKQAYAEQTVASAEFVARYPLSLTAAQYVDALFATAGAQPTSAERQTAINAFGAGGVAGRASALRSVADSQSVRDAEFRPSFVLMQYFGYLRRSPTDPPDVDDSGYQFWLAKLNQFGGNFVAAEMVKAFITSSEYRARFGPP